MDHLITARYMKCPLLLPISSKLLLAATPHPSKLSDLTLHCMCVMLSSPPSSPTSRQYVTPTDQDILCGRSRVAFERPANKKLRAIVFASLDRYKKSSRSEKTVVIRSIIAALTVDGGRFLKFDTRKKSWYDGGQEAAKSRIGSAMRDAATPDKVKYIGKLKQEITGSENGEPVGNMEAASLPVSAAAAAANAIALQVAASSFLSAAPLSVANQYESLRRDKKWVEDSLGRLESAMQSEGRVREWQASAPTPNDRRPNSEEQEYRPFSRIGQGPFPDTVQAGGLSSARDMVDAQQNEALMRHIVMYNATRAGREPAATGGPLSLERRIAEFNISQGLFAASSENNNSQQHQSKEDIIASGAASLSSSRPESVPWLHRTSSTAATSDGMIPALPDGNSRVYNDDSTAEVDQTDEDSSYFTALMERLDGTGFLGQNTIVNMTGMLLQGDATTRMQNDASAVTAAEDMTYNDDEASFFTAVLDGIDSPDTNTTSFESLQDFI